MKPTVRILVLILVLGFACLPVWSAAATGCRYYCGSTLHQTTSTSCCSQMFTCPNGQQVPATQVYSVAAGGWIYCP